VNICTIIAKNYLAHARVLAESFQELHPDGRCFVLVIDETDGYIDPATEPFELIRPGQIGLDSFDEMRGAYDVMELSTAVKPWLLRHMLAEHDGGGGVAYLDPDIRVLTRMTELEAALAEHAIVLTPHVLQGMPRDGRKPSETDILMAGIYNLGFIGLSDREDAHLLLDWWSERLLTDCHVAPERGLFVDQRWIDFVPGLVSDLEILRDPAYNIAYWNLLERGLDRRNGTYLAKGRPVRFFHFSGYDPARRRVLSKHQDRVQLGADGPLRELCDQYAEALLAAGYEQVRELPYEHDTLPSGIRLTKTMRALYRAGVEAGECPESVFTPAGEARLLAWLNEPAPDAPRISRFLHGLWSSRPDLQRAYAGVERGEVDGYVGWCVAHGREEVGIPDVLLPRERLEQHEQEAASPAVVRIERPYGVNVAGYLRSELGIGEVARQVVSALDAAGVPALPAGLVAEASRQGHDYVAGGLDENPFAFNLVCVNADGVPAFAQQAGTGFFEDRYTIGMWWWETSDFPDRFRTAFEHVDEVWVGSRFVADTLEAVPSPVPVVHVPIPVRFSEPPPFRPGEHRWPDAFTFLFSWDYCSVFARKNPLAVIDAYTTAFGADAGTALVLKCINPGFDADGHRRVMEAIEGRDDIVLIDDYLDPGDKDRLMCSCDCYVSLHRSEGLGLTMAEAMFHRKPVIATRYSGNVDFMTDDNSWLVDYELVPIGHDAAPYAPGGMWAEPDVAQAARFMREVFEQPQETARRADRAAHDIRTGFSAAAAGRAMRGRLDHIAGQLGMPDASTIASAGRADLRRLVRRGPAPTRRSRFGKPGGAVRKLILRAMRPYTAYQQQVNNAVERALVSGMAGSQARVLAQLRAQQAQIADLTAALARERADRAAGERELARGLEGPARLVEETRALPYMASDVLRTLQAGAAGKVLGYEQPGAAADKDDYREFEELFRGSEQFIADRQRRYLEIVGDCAPAVDVGCGRGEFLDVLAAAGIAATGVDSDEGMVARCREKGHADTVHGDGVAYLEGLEDAELGLVFCAQVIEHMPPEALQRFLRVAHAKLRPGGLLVAETVNPHSVAAMKAFWVDITHQHPLFPETMLALCRIAGFGSAYVFHPNGVGDVDADRFTTGEYAVVARR
jgi:glycosyltransferase involved in cell wall biosynthesis/SAM-dependent methyltransferase